MPTVGNAIDMDGTALKADCLVVCSSNLPPRAEWNQGRIFVYGGFELLQNRQPWVLRVQNGMAMIANDRHSLAKRSKCNRSAAPWAIERPHLWRAWRIGAACAHDHLSNFRKLLRFNSSNSTAFPKYKAGASSL